MGCRRVGWRPRVPDWLSTAGTVDGQRNWDGAAQAMPSRAKLGAVQRSALCRGRRHTEVRAMQRLGP
eukprot:360202-Chlamydomonas_euryale.AAC.14